MNEMTTYAASLTGAKGKALNAETITVGPKQLVKIVEEKPSRPVKSENGNSKSKKDDVQEVPTFLTWLSILLTMEANLSID
jgi:hypothetical protein